MNRKELEAYIEEHYSAAPEHLWAKYPDDEVFRHAGNRKWFALVATVKRTSLGMKEEGMIDVMVVKCDPLMVSSLVGKKGIYPAYHMNKSQWITAVLDGTASDEMIKGLLDQSFVLTDVKPKKKKKEE